MSSFYKEIKDLKPSLRAWIKELTQVIPHIPYFEANFFSHVTIPRKKKEKDEKGLYIETTFAKLPKKFNGKLTNITTLSLKKTPHTNLNMLGIYTKGSHRLCSLLRVYQEVPQYYTPFVRCSPHLFSSLPCPAPMLNAQRKRMAMCHYDRRLQTPWEQIKAAALLLHAILPRILLYLVFFPKALTADIEKMHEYLITRLLKALIIAEKRWQTLTRYALTKFYVKIYKDI